MITEDELKKYLPKYLSEENYNNLLTELKSFPYNIDNRMYTYSLEVGSINSIFYFLHKAAEPFNCLEQDNLA